MSENEAMQDELNERCIRYMRCALLNVIQHIDIYGKSQSSYAETRRTRRPPPISVAMNSCPKLFAPHSKLSLETRLSKMSTTTRTSSLYPGHDILARKRIQSGKKVLCNAVVPRD